MISERDIQDERDGESSTWSGAWNDVERASRVTLREAVSVIATQAGARLLRYLEDPALSANRAVADLESEQMIRAGLSALSPTWGLRAEEEPHLNQIASETLPFWLVDPNDGTSEFLKGGRGPSVSIALISGGLPVLGVIFAYGAPSGLGDLFMWVEGDRAPLRNGSELTQMQQRTDSREMIYLVSNSADRVAHAYQEALTTERGHASYRVAPGVAYRLALCAAGEAELAISLASPRDFDIAAGHALVRGVGGVLLDERGAEMRYQHERPTRLGLSFAGSLEHARAAVHIDWSPVFNALRAPQPIPFLSSAEVKLCPHASALDLVQGAWWGWHMGALAELKSTERVERAGDVRLIEEARASCRGDQDLKTPRLLMFLDTLTEALRAQFDPNMGGRGRPHGVSDHVSERGLNRVSRADQPQVDQPQTAIMGLSWGLKLGRRRLPARAVSALLSRRRGEMSTWQPDGDRIAEHLIALVPELARIMEVGL